MSEKKLTPMQELIAKLKEAKANESCASLSVEDGYDKAIQIAESKLEKEREAMIEFAEKMRIVEDVDFDGNIKFAFDVLEKFNETFKTEE